MGNANASSLTQRAIGFFRRDRGKLLLLWLAGVAVIALWLALDRRTYSWDQGRVLIGIHNYWWTLNHPQWLDGQWWERFWMLSSKFPPLYFITAGSWQMLVGVGPDRATSVNILYQGILLLSTYGLGRVLLGPAVGVWAAGIVLLFPRLYTLSVEPLIDYALVALVTASFCSLSIWRQQTRRGPGWLWAVAFGLILGASILTKYPTVFFFLVPLLWLGCSRLWQRRWESFLQLVTGVAISTALVFPWVRTNWIFLFSTWQGANVASATAEGDPALNTWGAWTYYLERLPDMVSWPLLLVPIVGALLAGFGILKSTTTRHDRSGVRDASVWLGGFILGSYLVWSGIFNKDMRFIAPYLPAIAVVLAAGLLAWPRRYAAVRWLTVALAAGLMASNLFSLGGSAGQWLARGLAPGGELPLLRQPDGLETEIVDRIVATSPHQLSLVGVLPSEPWLNQYNVTYAGALADYRVYGRNLGHRDSTRDRDQRHADWFVSVTDPQQAATPWEELRAWQRSDRRLAEDPAFQVDRTWPLGEDDARVVLYRRRQLPVTVEPIPVAKSLRLSEVVVPAAAPPGQPIPVTYTWEGPWQALRTGRVLLTWVRQDADGDARQDRWLHDRGIGLGTLRPGPFQANQFVQSPPLAGDRESFRVTERTAMHPEAAAPGRYTLEASYLDPDSGQLTPLDVPPVTLVLDPDADALSAPPLDYVTQVRRLAREMHAGPAALDGVFTPLERINLYDPIQNFYVQAEDTLVARLQQEPDNRDYAYGLLLARALQRKIDPSLDTLETIVALDRQNPYSHAYQAFVNLVAWRPGPAQRALEPALALAPESPEIQGLAAIADLMQGNVWGAWQRGRTVLGS